MKFKWVGANSMKDLDLAIYGIMQPNEVLMTGRIIEVPDSKKELIKRLMLNGNYEVYNEPKKFKKTKKETKKEKKGDK